MLKLEIDDGRTRFRPGEVIAGIVTWSDLDPEMTHLEARLIWLTTGKGTRDFELVSVSRIECAGQPKGTGRFEFMAPHRPHSCAASMLTIVWAIELIQFPAADSIDTKICIAPNREEIKLQKDFDDDAVAKTWISSS